ncbi:protein brambleberry-like [Anthonomus grandis grandis]|uniref:protein brambleberry-like n=1 Tax=Anthonomus grandis grandis TaxID=2921223 RepID=UPI0021657101|nr:protein brambleberry-like [Anthonomus grandis grandis]
MAKLYLLLSTTLLLLIFNPAESALQDYINGITSYLGFNRENDSTEVHSVEYMQQIPYEVSALDEKFIQEAVKLTGVAISELDSCQHRVVLKLKSDCNKMNDEQLAKMAVHLLNCQSHVEGRKVYPCSDEMSIKECTMHMDSDTWTSYHLMSNRARAVCYMVRQTQFRGLAEHTVNRLMEASKDQLISLGRIAQNQENILNLAEDTYDSLSRAQVHLAQQQKDMQQAQLHGQLALEDNIMRLVDEKRLIHETHDKLLEMTKELHFKLENSAQLIAEQSQESKVNHKELLDDILTIQSKANELFDKIDIYSEILLKQNQEFRSQYEATIKNLQEVNETVHNLVNLVGGTRQALEERLSWLMTALGGTDEAVVRLSLVFSHVGLMLIAMLASAFVSARASTRLAIITLPPMNLAMALYGHEYLDYLNLIFVVGGFIAAQTLIIWAMNLRKTIPQAIAWSKDKLTPTKSTSSSLSNNNSLYREIRTTKTNLHTSEHRPEEQQEEEDTFQFNDDFRSLTPPISRNGYYSGIRSRSRSNTPLLLNGSGRSQACGAKTRAGTPCKLSSLPGRSYCYRHQSGDSVMG